MNYEKILKKAAILCVWLLIWQAAALGIQNPILFAGPAETALALAECVQSSSFWIAVCSSFLRIGAGLLGGMAAGGGLAVISYRFPPAEAFWRPFISLIKAVPVASFAVLLLIWWGSAALSVCISFLVVLPYVYVHMLEGLKNTDRKLLEMAQVFRISVRNRIWYLYRPAVRPFLDSAFRIGVGMAWKSGVAAEVIGVPGRSIGEGLYLSKISLDTAQVFAWTAVVILLSVVTEKLLFRIMEVIWKWEPVCRMPGHGKQEPVPGMPGHEMQESACRVSDHEKCCRRLQRKDADTVSVQRTAGAQYEDVGAQYEDAGPAQVVLTAKQLGKSYDGKVVFADYSMQFETGKTYWFRTPSGSGKTTLFLMLAGLETPDAGVIKASKQIAFLFQEDRLCEAYSAVKNVALVTGKEAEARAVLSSLLPADCLDQPVSTLSGGMRRRVALVRAMEAEAGICLLDEPFSGLDEENVKKAAAYITAAGAGKTILIASHDCVTESD